LNAEWRTSRGVSFLNSSFEIRNSKFNLACALALKISGVPIVTVAIAAAMAMVMFFGEALFAGIDALAKTAAGLRPG
jgi:hypothetical protein